MRGTHRLCLAGSAADSVLVRLLGYALGKGSENFFFGPGTSPDESILGLVFAYILKAGIDGRQADTLQA